MALADDRRIELALSFLKPWPTLHLVYDDPACAAPASFIAAEIAEGIAESPDDAVEHPRAGGTATSTTSRDGARSHRPRRRIA